MTLQFKHINFQSFKTTVALFFGFAFALGVAEASMIYYDRLGGLGGGYSYALNLGLVYGLFFALPFILINYGVSASSRSKFLFGFGSVCLVVLGARYYRIFYGNLIDEAVWTVFGALVLVITISSVFRFGKWSIFGLFIPFLIFSGTFFLAQNFTKADSEFRISKPENRPNIIWITSDTLRADYISEYGSERDVFKAFESWEDDFIQFTHSYSQSTWTGPSVASMLTSLYPLQHGKTRGSDMNGNIVILPQLLKRVGYNNYAISNQPLVSPGWGFGKGFDRFYATSTIFMETTLIDILNEFWLEEEMIRYTSYLNWFFSRFQGTQQSPEGLWQTYQDVMVDRPSEPFFMYLYFFDPHSPYNPDPDWYPEGTESIEETPYFNEKESLKPEGEPAPDVLADIERRYQGEINDVGDKVDRILSDLKERGLYEDSLIIFTSDHGEEFYDDGGWLHGKTPYQHQVRVPLFLKLPGGHHGGTQVNRHAESIDLPPTILAMMDSEIDLPYEMKGKTLIQNGQIAADTGPTLLQLNNRLNGEYQSVLVTGEKKYFVRSSFKGDEESWVRRLQGADQFSSESTSDTVPKEYLKRIQTMSRENLNFKFAPQDIKKSQKEQLKALGYIN